MVSCFVLFANDLFFNEKDLRFGRFVWLEIYFLYFSIDSIFKTCPVLNNITCLDAFDHKYDVSF